MGRALVRNPQVFLFDEPLSNLDAELRVSMRVEIAKLHQHLGATMIYVTHDQTEAMTLADNIVVLRNGKVEQVGAPDELYQDPANLFVAGFIGSPRMNFLRAKATETGLALDAGPVVPLKAGKVSEVKVGIRPEHFVIGGGQAPILIHVDVVENLGGTRYLYGTTEAGEDVIVEARDHISIQAGETVSVGSQPGKVLAFSPAGERLRTSG
jgi:lactose/L-arabinose transport system ATP-binding protein